ncbi:hypothetical protein KQX54_011603 [Cotesia glomerata]|uniref:Uncharacterized protein n=1 Tax=Cotesia glomerata TaxID=32391 RepID=A0AAV7IV14_COTGL|nr:hypothetical protein KQX54_011603 [Cotesia glomerata]
MYENHCNIGVWKSWQKDGLDIKDIVWPGNSHTPPHGVPEKFYLRITFLEESPYINLAPPDPISGKCLMDRGVYCRVAKKSDIKESAALNNSVICSQSDSCTVSPGTPYFSPTDDSVFLSTTTVSETMSSTSTINTDTDPGALSTMSSMSTLSFLSHLGGACSANNNQAQDATLSLIESNELPQGWLTMTADERLTLVMLSLRLQSQKLQQLSNLTRQVQTLTNTIDHLSRNLSSMQTEQTAIKEDLAKLNEVVMTQDIATLKASSFEIPPPSAVQAVCQSTSELVISGIPESVIAAISTEDIIDSIFNVRNVSHLKSDVLNARRFDKKRTNSGKARNNNIRKNKNGPVLHSFIVKLKSPQIRDHMVEAKRNHKALPEKYIFLRLLMNAKLEVMSMLMNFCIL